jgi:hypothetical protein
VKGEEREQKKKTVRKEEAGKEFLWEGKEKQPILSFSLQKKERKNNTTLYGSPEGVFVDCAAIMCSHILRMT